MSKKNFKVNNPAARFINTDQTQQTDNTHNKPDSESTETKSKRLNLLVTPSLHVNLKKVATMEETSVNDLINRVLNEYVEDKNDLIEKYNQVMKKY
ncbi:toxin-antitoxin system HicB family antitoxin [Domibacillus sp. 8LH]|uniref:toxin-antitoxin system HicB family antitoxin n=1 Tax=Domibacillus sp. 8LH TaxID=3073900 RepID=UPI003181658B